MNTSAYGKKEGNGGGGDERIDEPCKDRDHTDASFKRIDARSARHEKIIRDGTETPPFALGKEDRPILRNCGVRLGFECLRGMILGECAEIVACMNRILRIIDHDLEDHAVVRLWDMPEQYSIAYAGFANADELATSWQTVDFASDTRLERPP